MVGLLNPSGEEMWQQNFVLSGKSSRYRVEDVPGTLSIKTVLDGAGTWSTREGRFQVNESTFLVLNDGQTYSIELDSLDPVETFCVFFRSGFVEHVAASRRTGVLGDAGVNSYGFAERLERHDALVSPALGRLQRSVLALEPDLVEVEEGFLGLAAALVAKGQETRTEVERLSFARGATKEEIFKRLSRARSAVLGELDRAWTIEAMASEAYLSPFHFHRCFGEAFGVAPSEYLRQVRCERAAQLLTSRKANVTEAAFAVGYSSPTSFTAAYKRTMGRVPSAN